MNYNRRKIALAITLLTALTGCVGYVEDGYDSGVVVTGPDIGIYGDFYDRGHNVHAFSHRGFHSRGIAHSHGGGRGRR